MKETELETYERMLNDVQLYFENHRKDIETQRAHRNATHIKDTLPKLMAMVDIAIWCRNGSICKEATHCEALECEYKFIRSDVVDGVSRCGHFQITTSGSSWNSAHHLFPPSAVSRYI